MSYSDINKETGLVGYIEIEGANIRVLGMFADFRYVRPDFQKRIIKSICNFDGFDDLLAESKVSIDMHDYTSEFITFFEKEDGNVIAIASPHQEYVENAHIAAGKRWEETTLESHSSEFFCEKCGNYTYKGRGHFKDCPYQIVFEVLDS